MNRKIKISFPNENISAIAELLENIAPKTCEVLWNLFPIVTRMYHDIWSGHITFFFLEPAKEIEYENVPVLQEVYPGDIFYYYRAPHFFRGAPYGKIEASEIGLVYDRDSQPAGPRGRKGTNIFGKIIENLEGLKDVCERTIYEGPKKIRIEQIEK